MDNANEKISVLIAEDHDLTRQGLIFGIKRDPRFAITGEATDGQEAVDQYERKRPALVIMDLGHYGSWSAGYGWRRGHQADQNDRLDSKDHYLDLA